MKMHSGERCKVRIKPMTLPYKIGTKSLIARFVEIDEQLNLSPKRNQLQDRLLAAYAEACGIEISAESSDT